jgi:hypothetical protein
LIEKATELSSSKLLDCFYNLFKQGVTLDLAWSPLMRAIDAEDLDAIVAAAREFNKALINHAKATCDTGLTVHKLSTIYSITQGMRQEGGVL